MNWRLIMGLVLCGACIACVKKAPPRHIIPPPPTLARSVQISHPLDQPNESVQLDQSGQLSQTDQLEQLNQAGERTEVYLLKPSQMDPEKMRGDVDPALDVDIPEKVRPKSRLLGCTGAGCVEEGDTAQGLGRYVKYKRTGYVGLLPLRTAYFSVKCANGIQGEELFFLKGKWCLISGTGFENKCHDKQTAMKLACEHAESIGLK